MISESERALIAACGCGYCGNCDDYISYINNDKALKKRVATHIRKQLDIDVKPEQVGCLGCWGEIHTDFSSSLDCEIRKCALRNGILTCALCKEFPCERLKRRPRANEELANLYRIKKIGLESWLNEVK